MISTSETLSTFEILPTLFFSIKNGFSFVHCANTSDRIIKQLASFSFFIGKILLIDGFSTFKKFNYFERTVRKSIKGMLIRDKRHFC